jgi:hypothetical protein
MIPTATTTNYVQYITNTETEPISLEIGITMQLIFITFIMAIVLFTIQLILNRLWQ